MFKKVLFSALLAVTLFQGAPLALAADCPEDTTADSNDHFSVFQILTVDECQNQEAGTTNLANEIKTNAEAEGGPGSVAAALILRAINILLLTIGTAAFVTIFYAGILMVTANGDETKLDRSKGILTQSILGVVVSFLAYYIVTFVQSFFY